MFDRTSLVFLRKWLFTPQRKPLVIRGARQVGKTWLVRRFAELEGKDLVEVNLEKKPQLAELFESNNPSEIIEKLARRLQIQIDPERSLLFIDEIQEKPALYGKLRWFAEDMPQLPLIAAGSLLEFIFSDENVRVPVGRIGYMYLEPMSFVEYLLANGQKGLVDEIQEYTWNKEIHAIIHDEIMRYCKEYIYVGGMPAAVSSWVRDRSVDELDAIKNGIISSYRDDFRRYGARIDPEVLDRVLGAVPKELARKFVYSKVDEHLRFETIKKAFNLLCTARVIHKIIHTSANGIPLRAESNEKFFKAIVLDVGLCSSLLGLSLDHLENITDIELINKGEMAEQLAGQLLRTIDKPYIDSQLYYWCRPEKGASAEIDYVIAHDSTVVPVEVKAGTSGLLKSLHFFMEEKKLKRAVRISSGPPQKTIIKVKNAKHTGEIRYELLSMPFYMVSELHRLIKEANA